MTNKELTLILLWLEPIGNDLWSELDAETRALSVRLGFGLCNILEAPKQFDHPETQMKLRAYIKNKLGQT